jgi:CBS-domain-containing membrane protein
MKSTVKDVMTKKVVVVRDSAPFKEVVRLMDEFRVSALPVVDGMGVLVGIVSEADLLLKEEYPEPGDSEWFEGRKRRRERTKAAGLLVTDMMTRDVVTIGPDDSLTDAARSMHGHRIKRLPVVDEEGTVLGIVSRSDLLKVFLRPDQEIEREIVEDLIERTLWLDRTTISVSVHEGVVGLAGEIERRSLAPVLVGLVLGVDGVVGVDTRLTWDVDDVVRPPDLLTPWGVYAGSLRPSE